jgi:hypothetical protein
MVALKKEQLEALRREATGQSTLSHVELDEENETFWAGIAHQLDAAKPQSTTTGLVEALDERKLKAPGRSTTTRSRRSWPPSPPTSRRGSKWLSES